MKNSVQSLIVKTEIHGRYILRREHVILNKHIERLQPLEHIEICPNSDLLLRVFRLHHF